MAKQKPNRTTSSYSVGIRDEPGAPGALRFTFMPKNLNQSLTDGGPPPTAPQYVVSVQGCGDKTQFHWITPEVPAAIREELEDVARSRVMAKDAWLERLRKLMERIKEWAEGLDWATKLVDKRMEDAEIGNYIAPALLIQREAVRLFLEPIARSAPRAEGVVDLYLMPSYDDIASIYYYHGRWNIHYMFQESPTIASVREAEGKPLTKEVLRDVFDEMTANAR